MRFAAVVRRIAASKSGYRCESAGGCKAWIGRKRDGGGAVIGAERVGLIFPIEEMRAHANRRKRVFGGLVIVEQVFGGVIAAAAFEAWRRKGEKACHFVGLQNDSVTAWDCSINLRGD